MMIALYGVYVENPNYTFRTYLDRNGGILFNLNSGCLDLFPATPQADPRLAVVTMNGYL